MGAVTLSLGYGIEVKPKDTTINIATEAVKGLAGAANFSAFLVNSIPALKYVPSWFPGAGWKKQAQIWRDWTLKMRDVPFEKSLQQLVGTFHLPRALDRSEFSPAMVKAEGTATPSLVTTSVSSIDESQDREEQLTLIRDTAGNFFVGKPGPYFKLYAWLIIILFVGGADTTVSAINTFMLMMLCYPEIQDRAQAELDRVVGRNQLPDFSDEPSLPFVSALVKESLRYDIMIVIVFPIVDL